MAEINYEKTLIDIVRPLCSEPDAVMVKQMESMKENEIVLYIYAPNNDLGRLIGKKGMMAQSIRSMMSVASILAERRLSIKFDTMNQ